MKKLILPALVGSCVLLGAAPLPAAQQVASYAEAQSKKLIKDDGIVVFAYADGWDRFSKKRCEMLLADKDVLQAAGDAVLLSLPIPEYTTEESKKKMAALCGELNVPAANSYPALIFFDAQGKHYTTAYGRTMARGTAAEVAEVLADRLEKGRLRTRLLAEAAASSVPKEKAAKTFEAYNIDHLTGFGKNFSGHLRKLDPRDDSGTVRAADYNHYGFIDELNKLPVEKGVKKAENMLTQSAPAYSDRQKQLICAAVLGMLRRKAGPAGAEDIRHFARKMKVLGPETAEGRAAELILRDWVVSLQLAEGWTPATLPVSKEPVEVEGDIPIDAPGTYTVRFDWKSGSKALVILGVELRDGETKVAEDYHKGQTGHKNSANIYTLKVDKEVKDPHLFISVDMPSRDSAGVISILKL